MAEDAEAAFLRQRLRAAGLEPERQAMLFDLAQFHERERRAAGWALLRRLGQEPCSLIEAPDALAALEPLGPPVPCGPAHSRRYRFAPQETTLRAGEAAIVADPAGGIARLGLRAFDPAARIVTLGGAGRLLVDRPTVLPVPHQGSAPLAAAVRDAVADQCGPLLCRALDDLLSRRAPALAGGPDEDILAQGGAAADPAARTVAGTVAAISRMQETVLPIVGPAGAGKTHLAARAILSLLREGHRIAVCAGSEAAVEALLAECGRAQGPADRRRAPELLHRICTTAADDGADGSGGGGGPIRRTVSDTVAAAGRHVVGGPPAFLARRENRQAFDWLFVDDAGQLSLADLLAIGGSARNIVLLGDPAQPGPALAGAHPHPAQLSCLDWVLGGRATPPPERGITLPSGRRMHPALCAILSGPLYQGRLVPHPDTGRLRIAGTPFPEAGGFRVPLPEGPEEVSTQGVHAAEVTAIAAAARALLAGTFTDTDGSARPLRPCDILVLAPCPVQASALRAALPKAIRVGPVERFQGHEAPVCLVSTHASPTGGTALSPRDRLAMALTRARALALVFAAPALLAGPWDSVAQMEALALLHAMPEARGPLA